MATFNEDEARRIFARAAERQHQADDAPPGLSLEELQEIGSAAGLSPEHVAAAVAEIRGTSPAVEPPAVWGIETDIRRSRVLPGPLTDEAWEGMVSRLRRTFKTKGITADVGRTREWTGTGHGGGLSNLHVVVEPVEGGTRVTLETSKSEEVRQAKNVPWLIAVFLLIFPALGAFTGKLADPKLWVLTSIFSAMVAALAYAMHRTYRTWSERRQGEFDALLDQFELLAYGARSSGPVSEASLETDPSAPPLPLDGESGTAPLGLDALGDAPEAASGESRPRTHS